MTKKENKNAVAKCPLCGSPVYRNSYGHYCGGACGMCFTIFGKTLEDDELRALLDGEKIVMRLEKGGKPYTARLELLVPEFVPFVDTRGEERARLNTRQDVISDGGKDENH